MENRAAAQSVANRLEKDAWLTHNPDRIDRIKEEFVRWLANRGVPEKVIIDWLDRQDRSNGPLLTSQLQRLENQIAEIRNILQTAPHGPNT